MPAILEVRTTLATESDARSIGRTLVTARLAACAQVVPGLTSIYTWEDNLQQETEVQLVLKTTDTAWPLLRDKLAKLHPYDTPEIIAVEVTHASYDYASWIRENCD